MLRLALASIAIVAAAVTANAAGSAPAKVPALYQKVYVPSGFDSNDHIQIVGAGMFRNTCYRPAETSVQIDSEAKKIFVGPTAYEYPGFCLQVVLPFDRTIDIGILSEGSWDVIQSANGAKLGQIDVKKATTVNADDYLYAPVSQAFLRQKGVVTEILLAGDFPNSCMSLGEVKVDVQPDVIVVQPTMNVANRDGCVNGQFAFNKVVKVDFVPQGRYLLHVRSMNSKAFNTLVDIK